MMWRACPQIYGSEKGLTAGAATTGALGGAALIGGKRHETFTDPKCSQLTYNQEAEMIMIRKGLCKVAYHDAHSLYVTGATLLILYYAWRRRDEEEGKKETSESDEEAKATEVSGH